MKYKTKRERFKYISIIGLLIGLLGFGALFLSCFVEEEAEDRFVEVGTILPISIAVIIQFFYCWTYDVRRNRMRKYGEKFEARIIGADCKINVKDEYTFYLMIQFFENGEKKIRYTEGYCGNPNLKLRSTSCNVYKWKNKYIEADLEALDKNEKPYNMRIPITPYRLFRKNKKLV